MRKGKPRPKTRRRESDVPSSRSGDDESVPEPSTEDEGAVFLRAMARLTLTPDKDQPGTDALPALKRTTGTSSTWREPRGKPDATIDLHGSTRQIALERLGSAVLEAHRRGNRTLLVITGKGTRSPGGVGVLRSAVESWLRREGRGSVESYCTAPRRLGGAGALVLYLRSPR